MRFFIFFIVVSFFCFEIEADLKSFNPEEAVWMIHEPSSGVQGTGFVVEKKFLVTALHVIEPMFKEKNPYLSLLANMGLGASVEDRKIVLLRQGSSSLLRIKRVVDFSYAYDLAVLEIEREVEHSLSLRSSPLKYGEPIFILGYPHGEFAKMESKLFRENVLHYLFDIRRGVYAKDNVKGASGSPVLDSDGRVIGVLVETFGNDGSVIGSMVEKLNAVKMGYLKKLIRNSNRRLQPFTSRSKIFPVIRGKKDHLYDLAYNGNPLYQYILAKKPGNTENFYVYWMKKAAGNNLPDAQYELAIYYRDQFIGEGDEESLRRSFYWMKRAARSGNLLVAQYELSGMYGDKEYGQKDLEKSFYWMKKAAKQKRSFPRVKYELAAKYDEGEGTEPNPKQSFYWMKRAAEQGLSEAQYELAVKYEKGDGIRKNLKRSFYWMKRAAEQGLSEAQYELAVKYEKGDGIRKNLKRSFYWMKQAAEGGSQEARYGLAVKYSRGEGTEQNLELAMEWFEKAENKNYSFYGVQLRIVNKSLDDKNFTEGLRTLLLFADMGNVLAHYKLAHMYDKGEGVERDPERSFYWMKRAAEGGYVLARYELAIKYEKGEGTEKNPELAQRYFELAAEGRHPLALRRCSGAF